MLGVHFGLKTFYYSLINKVGSKASLKTEENVIQFQAPVVLEEDDGCESCKL
jgi:hypothetical protein